MTEIAAPTRYTHLRCLGGPDDRFHEPIRTRPTNDGRYDSKLENARLEARRAYRSYPVLDLAGILFIHVEKMRHRGSHGLDAGVVEFHRDLAVKDLEHRAVPVFHDFVQRSKALVDELPQI